MSSDLAWLFGTLALTSLLLTPLMRLWRAELRVPFGYGNYNGSDDLQELAAIKGTLEHGWFLENPDLAAPFGQKLYDFPSHLGYELQFVVVKLLGVFFSDPVLVLNLYFLLSFPLVALASFLVLRRLKVSAAVGLVCSVLYALAPYHFLRGESHVFLAAYYSVPVAAYLILSFLSGKPLFRRRASPGPRILAWGSKRTLVTLALCSLVAFAGGVYYATFTAMLLIVATALALVVQGNLRMLIRGGVLLGVILGFLLLSALPYLVYEFTNGPNDAIANREAQESDFYGLRLTQMVLPAPGHQISFLSDVAEEYYKPGQPRSEGPSQSLGLVATFGFAWLLLVALAGCLSPRWEAGDPRHRQTATAAVVAFLIGTIGGFSSLFAYLVSPQIRSWNRISIFIAFFAVVAVALLLDALRKRINARRNRPVLVGALLSSVLLIGLYDQSNDAFVPDYSIAKDEYRDDAIFVKMIDRELPPQAEVFQLPYVPFPEQGPVNDLKDYELLKPYLHESDLRWSYGAVRGRPAADWQDELWRDNLADKPTTLLLNLALAEGFDGIYIARSGYPDRAVRLERDLNDLLGTEPFVSPDGRKSFFSLVAYKERQEREERESGP